MYLSKPNSRFKDSFIAALKEYQAELFQRGNEVYTLDIASLQQDFVAYVDLLNDQEKGERLPDGYVPCSKFWLIDNDEVIGTVAIRHTLNDFLRLEGGHIGYDIHPTKRNLGYGTKILELALVEAWRLGIKQVLVTCDADNIGSKKIIEANGGILEDALVMGEGLPDKLRYWIDLDQKYHD